MYVTINREKTSETRARTFLATANEWLKKLKEKVNEVSNITRVAEGVVDIGILTRMLVEVFLDWRYPVVLAGCTWEKNERYSSRRAGPRR